MCVIACTRGGGDQERVTACSKSACTPMESEIAGRMRRAKDKSPVEREACVAVALMHHKKQREETAEERERRSAADCLCRKRRLRKETVNERESILDKTPKLRRNRRHLRKKKHVWLLIGCAGSSNQKSSKRLD